MPGCTYGTLLPVERCTRALKRYRIAPAASANAPAVSCSRVAPAIIAKAIAVAATGMAAPNGSTNAADGNPRFRNCNVARETPA